MPPGRQGQRSSSSASASGSGTRQGALTFTTSANNTNGAPVSLRPRSQMSPPVKKKVKIDESDDDIVYVGKGKGKAKATEDTFNSDKEHLNISSLPRQHHQSDPKQPNLAPPSQNGELSDQETEAIGTLPWSQRYSPRNRDELAVHERKVADVAVWLKDAFRGVPSLRRKRRLLILTGPSGSGKTETIRQLAKDLDFEISEWHNDTAARAGFEQTQDWIDASPTGLTNRLRDFFSKSARFPTLKLSTHQRERLQAAGWSPPSTPNNHSQRPRAAKPRLLLLEDLPSLSHQPTLHAFQDILNTFVSQPPAPDGSFVPVCIILSEVASSAGGSESMNSTDISNSTRENDWMRPRRLVGEEIASQDSWLEIKFNPIARTFLKRSMLETLMPRVIEEEQQKSSKIKTFPANALIEVIAADSPGDIRSAVDALQQAYLAFKKGVKGFEFLITESAAAGKRAVKKQKKQKSSSTTADAPSTMRITPRMQKDARKLLMKLGLVNRESSLVLFHALGKLLYNKRVGDPYDGSDEDEDDEDGAPATKEALKPLPAHYAALARRKSKVNISEILSSGLDLKMMELFVHHNYIPYVVEIEQCESIMENFSLVDSTFSSDLYSPLITSHSMLLNLPSPVDRRVNPPRPVPTKPDLFTSQTILNETMETLSHLSLKTHIPIQQLSLEYIPILKNKIVAQEKGLNNYVPGLSRFNELWGKKSGWFDQANFELEQDSLPDLPDQGLQNEVAAVEVERDDDVVGGQQQQADLDEQEDEEMEEIEDF
ncbi:unnamed protein product [Sympodiomycopsis kandeliae]